MRDWGTTEGMAEMMWHRRETRRNRENKSQPTASGSPQSTRQAGSKKKEENALLPSRPFSIPGGTMSGSRNKRKRKEAAQSTPVKADKRPPRSPVVSVPAKPAPAVEQVSGGSMRDIVLTILVIVIATAIAYSSLYRNEFIEFDDNTYITKNDHVKSGLSLEGAKWAFSFEEKAGNYWQPLTWLTFLGIYRIFGLNSTAFHITNLLIHILNSLLLFFLLKRMTGRIYPSGLVAALFALHPLNVESVAWAAEMKTPASTFWGLLTLYSYAWYVEKKGVGRYAACLVCFCASLMFKPHLASLPFVMLLLDWWPLNRIDLPKITREKLSGIKALVLEKVPFFILSAASIIIAVVSLAQSGIKVEKLPDLPFRLENALVSYVTYIFKLVLPIRLAIFYPNPASYALWKPVCAVALLILVTFAVIKRAKTRPWLTVGWLWFLGALFPMIGFVRGGLWPEMANRFTYFPMIGVIIVVAWGSAEIVTRLHVRKSLLCFLTGFVIATMIMISRHYVLYWENGFSLFEYALGVTENNVPAYRSLGDSYLLIKNYPKALQYYGEALKISPENDTLVSMIALTYSQAGDSQKAYQYSKKALEMDPGNFITRYHMGFILAQLGRYSEAVPEFKAALELYPEFTVAREQLGIAYSNIGKHDEAVNEFSAIVRSFPNFAPVRGNLAHALALKGETQEAIAKYEEALRLDPNNVEIHVNFGILLAGLKKYDKAEAQIEAALRTQPDNVNAHINLGSILVMQGRFGPASEHLQKALKIDPKNELARKNLELIQNAQR
jgi:tetratricopeptide (TPR) repeat protein